MSNTTTLPRWRLPATPTDALAHLVSRHGWAPNSQLHESLIQSHRYAHGVDGRPDLADAHLEHAHGAPTNWPDPAIGAPDGWVEGRHSSMRPLTGVILGWNALMAAWIIYGLVATAHQSSNCAADLYADACRAGTGVGAAVAIGGILFLTAVVDVILAVIWMVTKKD